MFRPRHYPAPINSGIKKGQKMNKVTPELFIEIFQYLTSEYNCLINDDKKIGYIIALTDIMQTLMDETTEIKE